MSAALVPVLPSTSAPTTVRRPRTARGAPGGALLVATDGRAEALGALHAGVHLAERLGAPPRLLAIVPPTRTYGDADAALAAELDAERAAAVRAGVEAQRRQAGGDDPAWEPTVQVGRPGVVIADVARRTDARAVVLGLSAHDLADRVLGSATALQVLRQADVPVLAVPPTGDGHFRRIVVAVDFSLASARAAEAAADLLAPGGVLSLVHVRPRVERLSATAEAWDEVAARRVRDLLARLRARMTRAAPAGARRRGAPTVGAAVLVGEPVEELLGYAACVGADLIALGSQGAGALSSLLLGSVTAEVLHGVAARLPECAVLACPSPRGAERAERLERALLGTAERFERGEWGLVLRGFGERNAGRRTILEIDDATVGAQVAVRGYPLLGAAYDPHDGRVEVMLGDAGDPRRHLTRTLGAVASVAVCTGVDGRDVALRVEHDGGGQTLVRFEDA